MWYGKDTKELSELKEQYEGIFGYDPDGEMDLSYGPAHYDDYVNNLKEAIRTNRHLAEFVK